MTCVAGVVHKGRVWMGADSAASNGHFIETRAEAKIFEIGHFIIGYSTSFRMGQLLRFEFEPPKITYQCDLLRYMIVDFVGVVRSVLKAGGFAEKDRDKEVGGSFMVGIDGRLFTIDSDYQVGEVASGYNAIGCGAEVAKGSLFSTSRMNPQKRLRLALEASAAHSPNVRGPFTFAMTSVCDSIR